MLEKFKKKIRNKLEKFIEESEKNDDEYEIKISVPVDFFEILGTKPKDRKIQLEPYQIIIFLIIVILVISYFKFF